MNIYFFTRDTLAKKYGTSIHLTDFLCEMGRIYSIKVWEMNASQLAKRKLLTKCSCLSGLSVSNFDEICMGHKLHFDLRRIRNRYTRFIALVLNRIFPATLSRFTYLFTADFNTELSMRRFDSLGQDYEKTLVKLFTSKSDTLAVGTNYPWLSNLLDGLEAQTFSFIHDLRSRNLREMQERKFHGESLKEIEDELFFASKNDFLITSNLHDASAIKNVHKDLPVLNVSLSKYFSPKAKNDYDLGESIRFTYVDAGGFGDQEIRSFLESVWPKLIIRFPQISLRIVGGVCNSMKDLVGLEGVMMDFWVDQVETVYLECDIALILHFYRGGIKLKLFEALKNGVPVFASDAATDGLPSYLANSIEGVSFENLSTFIEDIFSGEKELREYFEAQSRAASEFLELGYSSVLHHLI